MPYVDEGDQPKQTGTPMWLPYAAGVVGAVLAFFLWGLLYKQMNGNQWLAPVLTGLVIGGAMRLAGKQPAPRVGTVAVLFTVVTALAGYIYRAINLIPWNPVNGQPFTPTVGDTMRYLFNNDMMSVILIAFGTYLAFIIARSYGMNYTVPPTHQPPPQ